VPTAFFFVRAIEAKRQETAGIRHEQSPLSSSNPPSTSFFSASHAAFASSPSAAMLSSLPCPAASIIIIMIDLPSTSVSSLRTVIAL
jgi:hypothetical protein